MLRNIYVTLTVFAILTTTGIAIEDFGVEGEDYEANAIIVKFKGNVEVTENTNGKEVVFITGKNEVDRISSELGVYHFEQITPLPNEPKDHPKGDWTWDDLLEGYEKYGIGRNYVIRYNAKNSTLDSIAKYEKTGEFEIVEPNCYAEPCEGPPPGYDPNVGPNDQYYQFSPTMQWYLKDNLYGALECNKAWKYEIGATDTVIAIIDSGINMLHPDLNSKIYSPWDCTEQNDRPLDYFGHGTACAGIAAAKTNIAGRGIAGVDWKARIMPLKAAKTYIHIVYDFIGWHYEIEWFEMDTVYLERALWHAFHCGADIISMSFSKKGPGWSTVESYCNIAYNTGTRGMLLFASAGNDNEHDIPKPARYGPVICVGATDFNGVRVNPGNGYSGGSNYGPEMELSAPGVHMESTWAPLPDSSLPEPWSDFPRYWAPGDSRNEQYDGFSGTSGAAPLAAGCASLLWSRYPNWSNTQIRSALAKSARDRGAAGRDDEYGWGIVDPIRAVLLWSSSVDDKGSSTSSSENGIKYQYGLKQNVPNPASGFTEIAFTIAVSERVSVKLYDVKGRCVETLVDNELSAGEHSTTLDTSNLASGIYLYSISTPGYNAIKKLIVNH